MTSQRGAELREREIIQERQHRFRGSARLSITELRFPEERLRAIEQWNVDRLVDIYKTQGCLRQEREHRILVLIESGILATALEASGVAAETVIGSIDGPLELHLPESSVTRVRPSNNTSTMGMRTPSVQARGGSSGESAYRADLASGTWSSPCGAISPLASEAVRYLQHIRNIWTRICMDRANVVAGTDHKTVEMLQLRAPCASNADRKYMEQEMDSKLLFSTITDISDRKAVRESIQQMRQIPSLFTFFEDQKYHEYCAKAFRSVIGSPQGTIHECMSHLYTRDGLAHSHLLVELQDGTFRECTGNATKGREFSYQQLWLYVMRHFPEMVAATPRKENGKTKPEIKEPDPRIWHGFATLARHLGFDSDRIDTLLETDPDEKAAREFLHGSRPPGQYSIKPGEL
ncbi:hypothetical protein C7212DRAFT_343068 [Tuber magnatum]|uniref:Uncharacterized protein n=1 Tax=Tuber magnatum TaxID=42249 RepID=A0A317SRW4_9PEZI|nr:hypothetical protein C7212DRAFT_343068 [Tuber magnatum]